jgi:hypothetical protein
MTPAQKVKETYKSLKEIDNLVKLDPNQDKNKLIVQLIYNLLENQASINFYKLYDINNKSINANYMMNNWIFLIECIIESQNL